MFIPTQKDRLVPDLAHELSLRVRRLEQRVVEQEEQIQALCDMVDGQSRTLETLQRRAPQKVRSFFVQDALWLARAIFTHGLRRGLRQFRDFLHLKQSTDFDSDFYALQMGNTQLSPAKLLRHYVSHGYREGLDPSPGFSVTKYLSIYPDVAREQCDPYTHYLRFGRREYRLAPPSVHASSGSRTAKFPLRRRRAEPREIDQLSAYLLSPADLPQFGGYTFSRLMYYLWSSRPDLKRPFDITTADGRFDFAIWFVTEARKEYGLPASVFPTDLLERLSLNGGHAADVANTLLEAQDAPTVPSPPRDDKPGANLIGYAFGEFGMGEHVRMVARALSSTEIPFGILDHHVGLHGARDRSVSDWITDEAEFDINIFHVNADVFPLLYFKYGPDFFKERQTIGYWAWELAHCPPEFDLALNMVDEVWAISEFVAESFRSRASVPVVTMPLAVTVPDLDPDTYTKAYYGLPDRFTYFFVFDAASYIDRKNPAGLVRAFREAFPMGNEPVQLVLKTMNTELGGPLWDSLLDEIGDDQRIVVIFKRFTRNEVFGLYLACDVFVSLHRSEGFGRCVAEAMAYGRPVICTDYSGTRDFANRDTACVVPFELVPVPEGAYPFAEGQSWAEPDIADAAAHMRRLFIDAAFRAAIAAAGQAYILENFNERAMGRMYARRLAEIRHKANQKPVADIADDAIVGGIDAPSHADATAVSDVLVVQGWAAAQSGIEKIELTVDGRSAGHMHYGILRPDVQQSYPSMDGADKAGFFHRIDVSDLTKGLHRATVTAIAKSGLRRDWSFDFTYVGLVHYERWLELRASLALGKLNLLTARRGGFGRATLVILDTGGNLHASLAAAAKQTYVDIQVVIASNTQSIAGTLSIPMTADLWSRIAGVAETGFVTVIEAGDTLVPWAVASLVTAHHDHHAAFVYGDEDRLSEDGRVAPRFKPGWSPRFLDHSNYIGRPWSVEVSLLAQAAVEPTSEYPLLQILGRTAKGIAHVPDILCSRVNIVVEKVDRGLPVCRGDMVSIIVPTCLKNPELLARCLDGLYRQTDYPNIDVIVVTNNLRDSSEASRFLQSWPVRVVHREGAFNWSALNNFGTAHALGDLLLYLNDDIEPLHAQWLTRLVSTLEDCRADVVGPLLRYPNHSIQHLGLNLIDYAGGARHLFRFCQGDEALLRWLTECPREVSGVTGACLLTTRSCFDRVNGFDEGLPVVCNDVDFCLKIQRDGGVVMIEPRAELVHHEGVSRGGLPEKDDVTAFWQRWEQVLKQPDRYTNPNLDKMRDDWMVDSNTVRAHASRKF